VPRRIVAFVVLAVCSPPCFAVGVWKPQPTEASDAAKRAIAGHLAEAEDAVGQARNRSTVQASATVAWVPSTATSSVMGRRAMDLRVWIDARPRDVADEVALYLVKPDGVSHRSVPRGSRRWLRTPIATSIPEVPRTVKRGPGVSSTRRRSLRDGPCREIVRVSGTPVTTVRRSLALSTVELVPTGPLLPRVAGDCRVLRASLAQSAELPDAERTNTAASTTAGENATMHAARPKVATWLAREERAR